ncbi:MAG TPA: uridine diphosphate-N-acetylglucosamine-binding protein YvcK, partial [Jatrophihabitantaceae bacterium]|nr:uridine diphosphate-N-acetylglucosamine-binding protein YvcK [Jatrophihabitantaceae bacterium]
MSESLRAVALGGGHGLYASLSALRLLTTDLTAVVTVADDGGSSGRIRRELGTLPPGDLRMALRALAGTSELDERWAELLQHRFGGSGALAGHAVGNLLLTGFLERYGDPVAALAQVASLVGAVGRVLPMSPVPLDLIAEVDRFDPDDPVRVRRIRGQSSIASTPGRVRSIRLLPTGAPACASAVDAVREADVVVLGPGSWFTSVIPHLLLHELGKAI